MKNLIYIQLLVLIFGTGVLLLVTSLYESLSYFLGSAIIFFNLLAHGFVWSRVIHKKLIALAVFVIVFKYAILGTIIYFTLRQSWVSNLWFFIGVGSFLFTMSLYAGLKEIKARKENVL